MKVIKFIIKLILFLLLIILAPIVWLALMIDVINDKIDMYE